MSTITLTKRSDGVAVLKFDTPDSPVNIISRSLFDEFEPAVAAIEGDDAIKAVVLVSTKPDGFIAGANVKEFVAMKESSEGESFSRIGHALLDRIAASRKPFVAAMHGATFGGGLEVALACHFRLATDDPKTVLALPEVTLGLLPGGGGTQRLPRLVGLRTALPMILTGQRIRARKALRIGLVDAIVSPFNLEEMAATAALRLVDGTLAPRRPKRALIDRTIELPVARDLVLARARRDVMAKTRGNYPAPLAALDCIGGGADAESRGFGRLAASPEAKALMGLFLATTELKKPKPIAEPHRIDRIGVLGAGLMGAGIAGVSLDSVDVTMRDLTTDALGKGIKSIESGLASRVKSGSLARIDADRRRSRLRATTELAHLANCDLVVEAVFEDLDLKRRVLADVEAIVRPDAIFASNTSALPIHEIARNARHPERVVGMHYFSPVHKMPLLEVVAAERSAPWAVATARAVGIRQGKTVIVVRDRPGFYTTRILSPFLGEAAALLAEGARVEAIDAAMKDAGFPMGPLGLLDEVGIDVGAHVSESLATVFADRGFRQSDVLVRMVGSGYLGKKGKRGFYVYGEGAKGARVVDDDVYVFFGRPAPSEIPASVIAERLLLLMVNEAAHCLAEGVIASPVDGDVGAVLGIGFPPFLGGPFRYVDRLGAAAVVERMNALAERHGQRFRPAQMLMKMVLSGERFHDA